jgi:pyruvate, water dikinase
VEQGIDSVSVTPDSVIKTIKAIHWVEQELKQKQAKSVA